MRESSHGQHHRRGHYGRLAVMVGLSFIAMYILMYAMVDIPGNVFNNVNQAYMAGLMAAPMVLIELALMSRMYRDARLNLLWGVGAVVAMALCWVGIRQQAGVTDQQFLRSMIPHHAGAVLMCTRNRLRDPDLQQLCLEIVASQREEIDRMKAKLE